MKELFKAVLRADNLVTNIFPNILEDYHRKISKNNHSIVALIQPLIIAVGQRLAQSQQIHLNKVGVSHLYEVSQEVLKDFVNVASVSIALLDKDLNYISMSPSWRKNPFLISKTSNPIGKNYKDVSPCQTEAGLQIFRQALAGSAVYHHEELCVLPDGREGWMRWEVQPWEEDKNKIGGISIFNEDITDQKALQQRANQLIKEKNDLESFAYMCPHDMRSHIKTLSHFISFLAKGDKRSNDADVKEYYKFIFEALENMKNLIDDCLMHAQIKTEALIKFPQDLNDIITSLIESLKVDIHLKKAQITWDLLPTVWCHKQTIKQVFENLMLNALKFCVKRPKIHISAEEKEKEWVIHFNDNGIGIAVEDQQRLFQSFYRIHSKDKFPGTGLGLSFCKKIIELHDGNIEVTSAFGKGSTFSLTLPKRDDHNDNYAALGNTTALTQ